MSELSERVRAKFNSEMFDHDKRPSEAMEAALAPVEAEIVRLREALKPFADACDKNTCAEDSDEAVIGGYPKFIRVGYLRAARVAMGESDE